MDENTEERLMLIEKILKTEGNISYYKEQVRLYTIVFQNAITGGDARAIAEVRTGLVETQTNLNSEQRMLGILKNRLESGNFSLGTTSSLGKRAFEQ